MPGDSKMIPEEDLKEMEAFAKPEHEVKPHQREMICKSRGEEIMFLIAEYRKLKNTRCDAADHGLIEPITETAKQIIKKVSRTEKTLIVGKNTKLTIIEEKSLPAGTIIIEGAMPV